VTDDLKQKIMQAEYGQEIKLPKCLYRTVKFTFDSLGYSYVLHKTRKVKGGGSLVDVLFPMIRDNVKFWKTLDRAKRDFIRKLERNEK